MSLRSTLAAAAAALTLALPLVSSADDLKIGYVDDQRILQEIPEGKAAQARLQAWIDETEKKLASERDTLLKEEEPLLKEDELLKKQQSAMSEATFKERREALDARKQDLAKREFELNQKAQQYRMEVVNRQNQELEPIESKIMAAITKVAEKEGFAFVFTKRGAGIAYAQPSFDVTNEVIRTYNTLPKAAASKPTTPAPKPTAKDAPVAKDAPKK